MSDGFGRVSVIMAVTALSPRALLGWSNGVFRIRSKNALVAIALLRAQVATIVPFVWEHSLVGWVKLSGQIQSTLMTIAPTSQSAPSPKERSALGIAEQDPGSCPSSSVAMDAGAQASCVAVAQ